MPPGWDYLRYPSVTIKSIDEHIKPKFEEFGFPLDDNYLYVGKYKDCRLSISIIDEIITIQMSTCEGFQIDMKLH